jgi:hypothetical protein
VQINDRSWFNACVRALSALTLAVALAEFDGQFPDPAAILRRRDNDSGWTPWEVVPPGQSLDWRISGTAQRKGTQGSSRHRG